MAPAVLEITIMAAEGLKNVSIFGGKMNPYAVAFVDPYVKRTTRVLHKGGSDPVWNDRMEIVVDGFLLHDPNSFLTIQVFNQNSITTTLVGSTCVMLQDILRLGAMKDTDEGDILTLQLWRPSGRPHGFVRVYCRLTGYDSGVPVGSGSSSSFGWQGHSDETDIPATGIPVMAPQPYAHYYHSIYGGDASVTSLPVPCPPTTNPEKFAYPYSAPYGQPIYTSTYRPRQRRNNNILFGVLSGALAAALLAAVF